MKICFLDVDGVLNSYRNIIAYNRYPWPIDDTDVSERKGPPSELDPLAIGMVRKLCELTGAKIVFESTWRKHFSWEKFGEMFNLPMIGQIDNNDPKAHAIYRWLKREGYDLGGVTDWIAIDDHDIFSSYDVSGLDLDETQVEEWRQRHVQTNMVRGFSFSDFARAFQVLEKKTLVDATDRNNKGDWAMKVVEAEFGKDELSHHGASNQ